MANFLLARVTEVQLLDIQTFGDVRTFMDRYPWLDAHRADVIGVYKRFTQFVHNGEVMDGSYTGLAARQLVAERQAQHDAEFESAVDGDIVHRGRMSRTLYNPSNLPERYHILAVNAHVSAEYLAKVFQFTTGTEWPLHLDDIHLVVVGLDELILCCEFDDLSPSFVGASTIPANMIKERQFVGLNTQLPQGAGLNDAGRSGVKKLLRKTSFHWEEQHASVDRSRRLIAEVLLDTGLPVRLSRTQLTLRIVDTTLSAPVQLNDGEDCDAYLRAVFTWSAVEGNSKSINGSPFAATEAASRFLDSFCLFICGSATDRGQLVRFCCADLEAGEPWTQVLETLDWLTSRKILTGTLSGSANIDLGDTTLHGVAVRLLAKGGCGVETRRQSSVWMVKLPAATLRLTRYFGAVEHDEQDITDWWTLPASIQPPTVFGNWHLVLRCGRPHATRLRFVWQNSDDPQHCREHQMKNLPAALEPPHRFLVNLVRCRHGLERIGRSVGGNRKAVRVGKEGRRFALSDNMA